MQHYQVLASRPMGGKMCSANTSLSATDRFTHISVSACGPLFVPTQPQPALTQASRRALIRELLEDVLSVGPSPTRLVTV